MFLKTIFIFGLALFLSSAMAAESTIPADKDLIQFETKLGIVSFAHKKHAELTITECKTCHHKMEAGDTMVKPCHECHQHKSEDKVVLKTSKAFHTRCIGCHEYTAAGGQNAGPLKKKCKLCHVKPGKE